MGAVGRLALEELSVKLRMATKEGQKEDRKKWSQLEKEILVNLVLNLCGAERLGHDQLQDEHWEYIAGFMYWPAKKCRERWLANLDSRSTKPWEPE